MPHKDTNKARITKVQEIVPASILHEKIPKTKKSEQTTLNARKEISKCIDGEDDRLVCIIGPCSIHDTKSALEYAELLHQQAIKHKNELLIVMRVYFEKPRTTIGWKGFINDPDLNNSHNINKGLKQARQLLQDISDTGLACATEFLDCMIPQYISDLVSWGAIGARTTESQSHRELASGMSCPIGFKNSTNGDIKVAVDAVKAATTPHHFIGAKKDGSTAIFETTGNNDVHVILRGGENSPNYYEKDINKTVDLLNKYSLPNKVMVDCSHGNSGKNYKNQILVADSLCDQIKSGSKNILGVMIESHLKEGNQELQLDSLEYGKSITDGCISFSEALQIFNSLSEAIKYSRARYKIQVIS